MYGLKKGIDLSFFTSKLLLQVCLGVNEVILNFDNNLSVTITSSFCCGPAKAVKKYKDPRTAAMALVQLLDGTVTSFEGSENGTLALHFSNGQILEIYDDSPQYESYTINYQEKVIVV